MRHNKSRYRLNRFTSWRKATLRSMAGNLILRQSIRTTKDKAKAARPLVENLISLARDNSLTSKRRAFSVLGSHKLVSFLFAEIGPRYKNISSGFTRIIGLGNRRGDGAESVIFELTQIVKKEPKKHKEEKTAHGPQPEKVAPEQKESPKEEKKVDTALAVKERPRVEKPQKPDRKFFKGLRNIFKKERDSL